MSSIQYSIQLQVTASEVRPMEMCQDLAAHALLYIWIELHSYVFLSIKYVWHGFFFWRREINV